MILIAHLELLIVCLIVVLHCSVALDVRFTPSGDSEQLPLSSAYRDKLRKLCTILHSGEKLPAEYANKRDSLKNKCAKLAADDANISAGQRESGLLNQPSLLTGLLAAGGAYLTWTHRDAISSITKGIWKNFLGSSSRGHKLTGDWSNVDAVDELTKMREARLKKLDEY